MEIGVKFSKGQIVYWRSWDGQMVKAQVIQPGIFRTLIWYYESWDHDDKPYKISKYKWNYRMWEV